jgi:ankyrin repeat protein
VRSDIFAKNLNNILACFAGLLFVVIFSLKLLNGPYPLWGKVDCGDLCDPTWWTTVDPEQLVAQLAFRGLGDRNYEHEPFLPLHLAVLFSKNEQVKILVNAGATVNSVNYHGATPLITLVSQSMYTCSMEEGSAAHNSLIQRLNYLLDNGADITTSDHQGQTALHVTHASFADILITAGADLNAQDNDGRTPLHNALTPNAFGQIDQELTKALLLAGADAHIRDQDGITPQALMQ